MSDFKYNLDRRTLANVIYDFKEAESEDYKKEIISVFCSVLEDVQPCIQYKKKSVSFNVDPTLPKELVNVFEPHTDITYISYNSNFHSHDPYAVLKQQLNKIFVKVCDKKVCLTDDYITNLTAPKRYYYLYRQLAADGLPIEEIEKLETILSNKLEAAEQARRLDEAWKLDWTYGEFMEFVKESLYKVFTNYSPPPEIGADGAELIICDFVDEDRYIVSYVWRSLFGYVSLYRKKLFGVKDRGKYKLCPTCGNGIIDDKDGNIFCYKCRPKDDRTDQNYRLTFTTEEKQFAPTARSGRPKYATCEVCGENFTIASRGRIPKRCSACTLEVNRKRKRDWISEKRKNG